MEAAAAIWLFSLQCSGVARYSIDIVQPAVAVMGIGCFGICCHRHSVGADGMDSST